MVLNYYNYPTEKVMSACSDMAFADGSRQDRLWAGYSQLSRLNEDHFPPGSEALKRFRLVRDAMLNHEKLTDRDAYNAIDNLLVLRSEVEDQFTKDAHFNEIISEIIDQEEVFGDRDDRPEGLFDRLLEVDRMLSDKSEDLAPLADQLESIAVKTTGKMQVYILMVAKTARKWSSSPLTWARYGWLNQHLNILQIASLFAEADPA